MVPLAWPDPDLQRAPLTAEPSRLEYIDRLKVGAVAAVFLIHVSQVFNPWDEWHITAPERSRIIGAIAVLFAPWIMPFLMLLAGMTAFRSLRRRSNGAYLQERARSLLVPLVVGVLTVVPPQVYLERRFRGQFQGSFLEFYPHFFDGVYPEGNLSWHHLWFLAHLFLYAIVALPLFRWWQRGGRHGVLHFLTRVASSRHGVLWLALPLVAERMLLWGVFPEHHMLTADWSNHAILFVAYVYGFALVAEPRIAALVDAQWRDMSVVAVVGTLSLIGAAWMGVVPDGLPGPYAIGYLAFWTLYAVAAWAWVVAVLGAARRWLDRPMVNGAVSSRAYIWYVVHQPVIIGAAYVVIPRDLPIAGQFGLVLLMSGAGTLAISEVVATVLRMPRLTFATDRLRLRGAPPQQARRKRGRSDHDRQRSARQTGPGPE